MNLVKYLMEHNLTTYGKVLDWWLTDDKFRSWESKDVSRFTKKLHRIEGFSVERDLHYGAAKDMKFPKKATRFPQIWIGNGSSEGRDWVRHIRNGIAHGNTTVRKIKDEYVAEMLDFHTDGKTQTAYILMPLSYFMTIMDYYKEVEKNKQ